MSFLLAALLTLTACKSEPQDTGEVDQDGDGYAQAVDCDDSDPEVHPDAVEVCDDVDNNCDGQVDESGLNGGSFYADGDEDGYGDPLVTQQLCAAEPGWVENSLDCDDADASVNPAGTELCDALDNDCDGDIDEDDAVDAAQWSYDGDGDGYGDSTKLIAACSAPANYVADAGDCDDANAFATPGRDELCATPYDDDCDGTINESAAVDATEWFPDVDGDGFGLNTTGVFSCEAPTGGADNPDDCDDSEPLVNPDALEVCDGVDNDCSGSVDGSDAADALSWYADSDGDGFGDLSALVLSCESSLSGYVSDATDCDDAASAVNPSATEVCDTVDNDCDGSTDGSDSADASTWYYDGDSDGYGLDSSTQLSCSAPSGYASEGGDCDDSDSSASPGETETCDTVDNDCDGTVDEDDAADAATWYIDADGDGEGASTTSLTQCDQPSGYVNNATDCDDSDAVLNSATTWYYDADLDGYGVSSATLTQCADPGSTYTLDAGDCRPGDADSYPGADEYCDLVDNDCDGTTDEDDSVDASTWYADSDGDGFGDATSTTLACAEPSGYVADDTDCDDADATITDSQTWYLDADGDGEGLSSSTTESCTQPSGYVSVGGDCDDADATLNSSTNWYYDADLDGYGTTGSASYTRCLDPGLYYVQDNTDCEPSDASSYPGATEECLSGTSAEGVDNDCDGTIDEDCPQIHCGTISSDETWSAGDEHLVTCNVYVQGSGSPVLTIDAGTTVEFNSSAGLWVGYSYDGDVEINGTSSAPVLLTSSQTSPAAGDWTGLFLWSKANGSVLDYVDVEYAGSSTSYPGGLYIYGVDLELDGVGVYESDQNGLYVIGGSVLVTDSVFQDNAEDGIYLSNTASLDTSASFTGNTLTGNGGYPMLVNPEDVGMLDASSTFSGNGEDLIYVRAGTMDQDTTWSLMDVDYLQAGSLYVQSSGVAPLWTIEDGVRIEMASLAGLFVGYSSPGEVDIQGTSSGVTITSAQTSPAAGDWYGLVLGTRDRDSSIEGLTLGYGGYASSWPASLYIASDATVADSTIHDSDFHGIYIANAEPVITGTTLQDNDLYGLYVYSGGLGASFTDNTLTGNDAPIYLPANYLGLLDSSSAFTGNTDDVVQVAADTVDTDATWQLLDVDYEVQGSVYIQGSSAPTVTIEDEVRFAFTSATGLWVGWSSSGALDLQGDRSSGSGIVFTSAQSSPVAGDWYGLIMGGSLRTGATVLEGFTVEYGGGTSSYPGNVVLYNTDASVSDCALTDSAENGLFLTGGDMDMSDCELNDNDGTGLYLNTTANLDAAFTDNEMSGNGEYPVVLPANSLGYLDSSSSYSGNGSDYVYVHADTVNQDATWQALDVDYYMSGDVYIQVSGGVTVDTDSANFYFASGKGLYVGNGSAGTFQASNSLFSSALSSPSAGDWDGLYFGYYASDALCEVDSSTVEYGGSGSLSGNIVLYNANITVTNNSINDSSGYGIYAYNSSSATVSGNTYSGNASGDTIGL